MSVCIIAKYNSFHNGHIFQLNKTKVLFFNKKIIILMSRKYVQQGEIVVASFEEKKCIKIWRKKVIKLAFKYATQAAHIFAKGAIEIVAKNNIDKFFWFRK